MRKYCSLLLILIVGFSSHSQEAVFKITKSYFRSDPFRGEFSAFMKHLLNDPSLSDKTIEKRTDSSLFFFHGRYAAYNPFFFKPKRVEVILREIVVEPDSLWKDTIFAYQLYAFIDDTKDGAEEINKEFEKIFKHYKNSFKRNEYTESLPGSRLKGGTYNFFDLAHAVAPFALSLYGPDEKKEICLILTIRMDTYNNLAMLPLPFIPVNTPVTGRFLLKVLH